MTVSEKLYVLAACAWMTLYLFGAIALANSVLGPIQATWQWYSVCFLIVFTSGLQRWGIRHLGKTLGFA